MRKSKHFDKGEQSEATWQPHLIDYISLNDQIMNDKRSVNTRFKTLSNKLSDISYTQNTKKE